ncbi:alpha-ribazole phosphatase [Pedobacter sp. PLR]|uniref:alpha-ribazole phosphatase n=1 Tax=Pedobacter sp. PLR TaxID=2994465 RepID=UPI002247902F|nr:alpha-ribazole phosphatase [Pedobacter sp. PLR]MCX2450183.1 alpha-ribazole phosphatase [Pedobacter sp. PLR]
MEVYVIRHTAVAVEKGTCYGQFDVPLAASATQDINEVIAKLPDDFDQVYSSPSSRCSLLADQLPTNSAVENRPDLMEMNFGDWENSKWNDMDQILLGHWMNDFVSTKTPSGESLELLYERVNAFIAMLRTKDLGKVAIVTHAGVIRCIWAIILDIPLRNIFKISVDYGSGIKINLNKDSALDQIKHFSADSSS